MQSVNGTTAVIQSDPSDVGLLLQAFSRANYPDALEVLKDGEESLAYFAGEGKYGDRSRYPVPTAIILDLDLSGMSGFEVLEWLRDRPQLVTIPVFVLASSRQPRDVQRAYALGARSYFVKPMGPEGFKSLLQAIAGDGAPKRRLKSRLGRPSEGERKAKVDAVAESGLKRIAVGSSSENPHIHPRRMYRVRIEKDWYEGTFSKRWFGWIFNDYGDTGMQLNLIDEVFEVRVASARANRWRGSSA